MNRQNPFTSNSFFKPATSILRSASSSPSKQLFGSSLHRKSLSLDDSDTEAQRHTPEPRQLTSFAEDGNGSTQLSSAEQSSSGLMPAAIPLVTISRSPSPFARSRSAAQSEDEDEDEIGEFSQSRPLVVKDNAGGERSNTQRIFQNGGLGHFLFGTAIGWIVYL